MDGLGWCRSGAVNRAAIVELQEIMEILTDSCPSAQRKSSSFTATTIIIDLLELSYKIYIGKFGLIFSGFSCNVFM